MHCEVKHSIAPDAANQQTLGQSSLHALHHSFVFDKADSL